MLKADFSVIVEEEDDKQVIQGILQITVEGCEERVLYDLYEQCEGQGELPLGGAKDARAIKGLAGLHLFKYVVSYTLLPFDRLSTDE